MGVKSYKPAAISAVVGAGALIAAYFMVPFEGDTFKSYRDGAGIWTICRGHTQGVTENETATKAQCDYWYQQDIGLAQMTYTQYVKTQNPPNVEAAAISFIFNTGAKNFINSSLRKKLNKGDAKGACDEFLKWKYVAGKDCSIKTNNCYGIVVRRYAERSLCLDTNYYSSYHLNPDNVFVGVRPAQPGN